MQKEFKLFIHIENWYAVLYRVMSGCPSVLN